MRKAFIILFTCLAFWLPAQAGALIIGIPNAGVVVLDYKTYYNAGLCRDKAAGNIGNFYTWAQFNVLANNSVNLAMNEVICIVGHGAPGDSGGHTGVDIGNILRNKIRVPANTRYILLKPCSSAVAPAVGNSLLVDLRNTLQPGGNWRTKEIYGSAGICSPNRYGVGPYYKTVFSQPLPAVGNCTLANIGAQQTALEIAHGTAAAFGICTVAGGGNAAVADCVYANQNIRAFYVGFLNYVNINHCVNTAGTVHEAVPAP